MSDHNDTDNIQTDISDLSYEQARDELITVVQKLEQGSLPLQESLELWERGEALARRCEKWLLGAKERLEQLSPSAQNGHEETVN